MISDSLYSLIIFIYVSITFLYMFYAFCWRSPDPKPLTEGEKNLPMITEEITAPGDHGDDDGGGDLRINLFLFRRRVREWRREKGGSLIKQVSQFIISHHYLI